MNKKNIIVSFGVILIAVVMTMPLWGLLKEGEPQYFEVECRTPWLLVSSGLETTVQLVPEEHGRLVAFGNWWLVVFDPETHQADVRHGDKMFYAVVTVGEPEGEYCGTLYVTPGDEFFEPQPWMDDPWMKQQGL